MPHNPKYSTNNIYNTSTICAGQKEKSKTQSSRPNKYCSIRVITIVATVASTVTIIANQRHHCEFCTCCEEGHSALLSLVLLLVSLSLLLLLCHLLWRLYVCGWARSQNRTFIIALPLLDLFLLIQRLRAHSYRFLKNLCESFLGVSAALHVGLGPYLCC